MDKTNSRFITATRRRDGASFWLLSRGTPTSNTMIWDHARTRYVLSANTAESSYQVGEGCMVDESGGCGLMPHCGYDPDIDRDGMTGARATLHTTVAPPPRQHLFSFNGSRAFIDKIFRHPLVILAPATYTPPKSPPPTPCNHTAQTFGNLLMGTPTSLHPFTPDRCTTYTNG